MDDKGVDGSRGITATRPARPQLGADFGWVRRSSVCDRIQVSNGCASGPARPLTAGLRPAELTDEVRAWLAANKGLALLPRLGVGLSGTQADSLNGRRSMDLESSRGVDRLASLAALFRSGRATEFGVALMAGLGAASFAGTTACPTVVTVGLFMAFGIEPAGCAVSDRLRRCGVATRSCHQGFRQQRALTSLHEQRRPQRASLMAQEHCVRKPGRTDWPHGRARFGKMALHDRPGHG